MSFLKRIFFVLFCAMPFAAGAQVATTAGSNLTAWNGESGSTNNNTWNQLMNNRTLATGGAVGAAPVADFGNCNSLVLRCAQPKCAGCTTMDIARPIVAGCVNSNETCKKYGDDLIEFISAQMVSNATGKAQQAEIAAQQAAVQNAAAQNNAQLQQMQSQMMQMQQQMQQQNAQQMAQMQAALDEQKAMTAAAIAQAEQKNQTENVNSQASVPSGNGALTDAQVAAAEQGVAAEILARQQIAGQIMSKIEAAEVALKSLKATMGDAFEYGGCDSSGNNCVGPRRAKVFKQKALQFFDPYNDVLDELYDALITAQAVGVDITDIYMMLNGSCNVWGEYLCSDTTREEYDSDNCKNGKSVRSATTNGGHPCSENQVIPAEDSPACVLQKTLKDAEEVQRSWLDSVEGTYDETVRVGCASAALETSTLFRNRKKQATIDIEILERIIEQDSPAIFGNGVMGMTRPNPDGIKYCAVHSKNYQELQKAASTKSLPGKVCVSDKDLERILNDGTSMTSGDSGDVRRGHIHEQCKNKNGKEYMRCLCKDGGAGNMAYWDAKEQKCLCAVEGYVFNHNVADCVVPGAAVATLSGGATGTVGATTSGQGGVITSMECTLSGGEFEYGSGLIGVCKCGTRQFDPRSNKCVTTLGQKIVK